MPRENSIDIDTFEDLQSARNFIRIKKRKAKLND
jgi:CMP-N-acetylneuraminic acid synthetase